MKCLPLDLDKRSIILRLAVQKDRVGSALAKALSKPDKKGNYDRSAATLIRVDDYCDQDVQGEIEDFNKLGYLPPDERRVWLLDQRINERGIKLDLPFITAAQKIVREASVPLLGEFSKLTGGLKPTQVEKFMGWMEERGTRLPNLQKETLAALLGSEEDDDGEYELDGGDIELSEDVHRALSIRQLVGSASVKKLARMDQCVCFDGRARGTMQYHGAGPGRWAGRLFQPHNFPRGVLRVDGYAPDPNELVATILTGDYQYV
jgi:DNA polymerase